MSLSIDQTFPETMFSEVDALLVARLVPAAKISNHTATGGIQTWYSETFLQIFNIKQLLRISSKHLETSEETFRNVS